MARTRTGRAGAVTGGGRVAPGPPHSDRGPCHADHRKLDADIVFRRSRCLVERRRNTRLRHLCAIGQRRLRARRSGFRRRARNPQDRLGAKAALHGRDAGAARPLHPRHREGEGGVGAASGGADRGLGRARDGRASGRGGRNRARHRACRLWRCGRGPRHHRAGAARRGRSGVAGGGLRPCRDRSHRPLGRGGARRRHRGRGSHSSFRGRLRGRGRCARLRGARRWHRQ